MNSLGERIKFIRENVLKLKQFELAKKLGVKSKGVVSNWENNKREPDVSKLVTLSFLSEISLQWLLAGTGQMKLNEGKVGEPKIAYLPNSDEMILLKKLFQIPEAHNLIYQYIKENVNMSEIASELFKVMLEDFSQTKKE